MPPIPKQQAREAIDRALKAAGGVQDVAIAGPYASGVAVRDFPLAPGYGHADCLLYVSGKAAGSGLIRSEPTLDRAGGARC